MNEFNDPLSRLMNAEVQSVRSSPGSKIKEADLSRRKVAGGIAAGVALLFVVGLLLAGRVSEVPGDGPNAAVQAAAAKAAQAASAATEQGGEQAQASDESNAPSFASAGPSGTAGRMSAMFGAARDESALATELKKEELKRVSIRRTDSPSATTRASLSTEKDEKAAPSPAAAAPTASPAAPSKLQERSLATERTIVYGVTDRKQLMGRAAGPVLNVKGGRGLPAKGFTPDIESGPQATEEEVQEVIETEAAKVTAHAEQILRAGPTSGEPQK